MLFSDAQRYPKPATLFSTSAVAALAYLREETFPQFIDPPQFIPRRGSLAPRPEWLVRLLQHFKHQVAIAATVAIAALILAAALPAWASFQQGGPAGLPSTAVRSSTDTTGTAATRVDDLGAVTFLGRIPFVQQIRYMDALAGTTPVVHRFVSGAREATLAEYLYGVSAQVALPYLSDAVSTKQAIEAWTAAVERQRGVPIRAVWGAPALAPGTRISGARVTFYACIGNGFCGTMASGQQAFEGAAACSADLVFGTRFIITSDPTSRVFVCLDRGALASPWVDVWFYDVADGRAWQSLVGDRSDIIIVD